MDHPLSDPGDSDGAGAFVTPREDPLISLAVAEDTDSIDIVDDDDNRSITKSPDQMGAGNVVLTKAFVSARGSQAGIVTGSLKYPYYSLVYLRDVKLVNSQIYQTLLHTNPCVSTL